MIQQDPTFINFLKQLQTWLIKSEGNMGVTICLGQGGLHFPNVSCSSGLNVGV